ncbi:alpha/beta fold hydrolase [Fodinicola feengrottensis]|uniref:alpha/beta fold hydrolase n=1 Tax=Fodinicola feengrottensis TaxID=435914 RepID=UPI0013D88A30|nr:alpha/beta fold hydrolase [Fodinicola feengrottensis]
MDVIRAALGEQKINYLGYSYGTYLGSVYATLFPTHARRFILDSNVDPTGVWYDDNLGQNVAFDKSFHEFLRWIASNDAVFHLGTTEAKVSKAWYGMRAALKKNPAGGVVGAAEFDNAGSGDMYSDSTWPALAQAVSDYVNKHDDAGILAQYGPTDLAGENGNTIYTVVSCNDQVWPHNLQKWYGDAAKQYQKYPFLVYGNLWFNMPCAFWPYGARQATRVGSTNVPNTSSCSTRPVTPATPYDGALNMHKALRGSKLVTVTGQFNHGQYLYQSKNTCTLGYGNDYLLTGKLPKTDVTCVGDPHPTPTAAAAKSQAKAAPGLSNDLPGRAF